MKKLINLSNHDNQKWGDAQKANWDNVEWLQFPNIPATATTEYIIGDILPTIVGKIGALESDGFTHIMLQGEFSFSYILKKLLEDEKSGLIFVIPSSERIVEEVEGKKISKFEFKLWRELI